MKKPTRKDTAASADKAAEPKSQKNKLRPKEVGGLSREVGGPGGPEPTRYGDWERKGIVSDF